MLAPKSSTKKVTLPDWDYWEITFQLCVQSHLTPLTHPRFVEALQPEQKKALEERQMLIEVARSETVKLKVSMDNWTSKVNGSSSAKEELESRLWKLHRQLSKAQSRRRQLRSCLTLLTSSPEKCKDYMQLVEMTQRAFTTKKAWDASLTEYQKRDQLKQFQHDVTGILESDDVEKWTQAFSNDELFHVRGNANRLVQFSWKERLLTHSSRISQRC